MAGTANGAKLDISQISGDNVITIGSNAWVKAEVEEKIFIIGAGNNARPYAVIKFSDGCFAGLPNGATLVDVSQAFLMTSNGLRASSSSSNSGGNSTPGDPSQKSQTICGISVSDLEESQKAMDANSINDRGFQPAAVIPSAAVIPMRSNIFTYGPYASSNFYSSAGGTNIEVNQDLAPWVFGSTQAMNLAGNMIVANSAIGLTMAETGGVTIPGLPDLSSLGAVVGTAGPNLTGISFTFGSSGVTSSFDFKTYTPKFGNLARPVVDKLKSISKNRVEQLRYLRNNQITQNKIGRKISKYNTVKASVNADQKSDATKNSMSRVIMGEIYDWQSGSQRTVVGTETLAKSSTQMAFEYDKKAYMSFDGLFGPVSINGAGNLPRFAKFTPLSSGNSAASILPMPPYSRSQGDACEINTPNQNTIGITQKYLNPLTNKSQVSDHHHTGDGAGHVIDLVGRESEVPTDGLITNFYHPDNSSRYSSDYRFIGLRGPLVLHSWGYDTDGKPIPNEADTDSAAQGGNFTNANLKDKFLNDWLKKPASWPVAPVDLRFDRERGVWVSPQPYKIVVAKIVKKVPANGIGKAIIINYGKTIYDDDGQQVNINSEGLCEPVTEEYEWTLVQLGAPYDCVGQSSESSSSSSSSYSSSSSSESSESSSSESSESSSSESSESSSSESSESSSSESSESSSSESSESSSSESSESSSSESSETSSSDSSESSSSESSETSSSDSSESSSSESSETSSSESSESSSSDSSETSSSESSESSSSDSSETSSSESSETSSSDSSETSSSYSSETSSSDSSDSKSSESSDSKSSESSDSDSSLSDDETTIKIFTDVALSASGLKFKYIELQVAEIAQGDEGYITIPVTDCHNANNTGEGDITTGQSVGSDIFNRAYTAAQAQKTQKSFRSTVLTLPRSAEDTQHLINLHNKLDNAYSEIENLKQQLDNTVTAMNTSNNNNNADTETCQKGMAMYFRKKRRVPKPIAPTNVTIPIVDRLGRSHQLEELVYAYYDSYANNYIVLQSYPDHTGAIYGEYIRMDDEKGSIRVEGVVGGPPNVEIGSLISVMNKLNLCSGKTSNTIWGNLIDSYGLGEPVELQQCANWEEIESNRNRTND
jgi:hypothetical protein